MNAAVILAAGSSSRMGSPKALLKLGETTFLKRIADTIRASAVEKVMVAVSQNEAKILEHIELIPLDLVYNTATPTATPLGSIQAAIRSIINQTVDSLLVWPVDQPHVLATTARQLISAFLRSRSAVTVPTFEGRRGHPVIFGRAVFLELLHAPASEGARSVVRADRRRVLEVPVSDPAVLDDIDTPEDYERLVSLYGSGSLPI